MTVTEVNIQGYVRLYRQMIHHITTRWKGLYHKACFYMKYLQMIAEQKKNGRLA